MRKRFQTTFISCILICCLAASAMAVGDPNMDGGGGGMGSGTSENYWNPGWDGIRVTVIRASDNASVTTPIDYTNKSVPSNTRHFGKVSKLDYKGGAPLSPKSNNYASTRPSEAMPTVISTSGSSNIQIVKDWWCTTATARILANDTGLTYEQLTGGGCVLLLEPIAYFRYNGDFYAMTATEAGMFMQHDSGLYSAMRTLTAQNLPFSLFLETNDLGFSAYTGQSSSYLSYGNIGVIKTQLGIGTVRYAAVVCDVTFNLNYTGGGIYRTVHTAQNTTISAPTPPTRSGYIFQGWYTSSGCTSAFNFSTPITANRNLYAGWRPEYVPPPDWTDGYTIEWTEQESHGSGCRHYYTYRITLTPSFTLTPSTLKSGYGFEVAARDSLSSVTQIGYGGDCDHRPTTRANTIMPALPDTARVNVGWTVSMRMANGAQRTQPSTITLDTLTTPNAYLRTWQAPQNPISETRLRKIYTDVSLAGTLTSPRSHSVTLRLTGGGIAARGLYFNTTTVKYITINGVMYEDDHTGHN